MCIQLNVENYNCSTHKFENKKKNHKIMCGRHFYTDVKRGQ